VFYYVDENALWLGVFSHFHFGWVFIYPYPDSAAFCTFRQREHQRDKEENQQKGEVFEGTFFFHDMTPGDMRNDDEESKRFLSLWKYSTIMGKMWQVN
jgi:hypothetical protein